MADENKEAKSPPKKKSKLFKVLILIILVLVLGAGAAFYLKGPMFNKVTGMSSKVLRMKIPASKTSPRPSAKPVKKATVKPTPKRSLPKTAATKNKAAPTKVTGPGKDRNPVKIATRQSTAKPADVNGSSKVAEQVKAPMETKVTMTPVNSPSSRGDVDYGFELRRVETLLENDPDNANAVYNKAWLNERSGNLVSAQKDYSKAIKIDSGLADAYFNRGLIFIDVKKYDQAVQDFTEVIKMEPRSVDAYCNRGNAYFNLGKKNLALKDYDAALKMDPNDAELYFNRGIVLLDKGDNDAAMADFNKALNLGLDRASQYLNASEPEKPRVATSAPPQVTPRTSTPPQTGITTSSTTPAMTNTPTTNPGGSAAGKIHGAEFKVDQASIANGILTLREGSDFFPDYAVLVFLFLKEGETAEGRTFNITKEQGFGSPHIHMKWKQKGQNTPKTEIFMKDYTMRLQFGKKENNVLPGKISLSLPDKEKSFVNGSFYAEIK